MINDTKRQLSIDLITDTPNDIITWFNDLWSRMHVIETEVYYRNGGELIYYIINDNQKEYIFYHDKKYNSFWCSHYRYWTILESKFNLSYTDIQDVTEILVENALNHKIKEQIRRSIRNKVLDAALKK